MAKEKVYPEGIRAFSPSASAPDFVKASIVITPNELMQFIEKNKQHLSKYKGSDQLRLQLLSGNKGLYLTVDTYKSEGGDDLPF